ncbi:hypothetical protein [Chryseobacterium proteolyticum]|uniref:hypothetical protein n=1 Tax=Chryseobacterium proteolyticum TaxID=118127 RepID=UPI003983931B
MVLEPKEFIKNRINHSYILKAQQQHKDLSYFTQSALQDDITVEYLRQWANRKYATSDKFLNWVKAVFKTDNFLSFFKYLRNPLASAKLINDDIKPQLRRVFHADDSIFKYTVNGIEEACHPELMSDSFDDELFNAILFNHNSIVVQDIDIANNRYREFVQIDQVISVDCEKDKINKLAYKSCLEINSELVYGFSYLDSQRYIFFDKDLNELVAVNHDLKECPADWVSSENMFNDNCVIKKSIFSYALTDLEEYVFLKTLQRMTEPNGAIPITTKLKSNDTNASGILKKTVSDKEPMSSLTVGGQSADIINGVSSSESQLQAGTIVAVAPVKDPNGNINMDPIKHYFQFHYLPVESLTYLNDRIKEIENAIKSSLLGDFQEQNEAAKNELQVAKGYDGKEDTLRWLSKELSRIKKLSDYKTLALLHGRDRVTVEVFFGTDFFIESLDDLFSSFKNAPNAIERRKILKRISQNKNKYNLTQAKRDVVLYMLLPYASDTDFEIALKKEMDNTVFQMQTRFDYWISMFEAEYGQIEVFYDSLGDDLKESSKIILITNLIKNIINNEQTISNA